MRFRKAKHKRVQINITPLIDVLFLLLIFFMLSTTFDQYAGLKLELPQASAKEVTRTESLEVLIDAQGRIYIDQEKIPILKLEEELQKKFQKEKYRRMLIRADRNVSHGYVVEVMDVARKVGFRELGIATELKNE